MVCGKMLALAEVLVLLSGSAARAQQAGDTTSVSCGPPPPLPLLLCVGLDGGASIDPAAGKLTQRWLMGDGTTLTGPVISHCYKERKNYVVQLDVLVDSTVEVRQGQKYIPIDFIQQDIVDFTAPPSRVKVRNSVAFAASDAQLPACQNVQMLWDFRDGKCLLRFSMRGYGSNASIGSHCVTREVVVEQ
ncbi:hypothetical protein BEN48_17075 [Hymenobacter glacialis]|uniref:PKD domain-containing protein n=2 Tax=Hymenobacter glacialis TaxID=1908236 RepID=A0A1G1SXH3_9BACT|nr:hypothetical protein BEN48_17075 [Hymenobacter glacialis]